MSGVACWRCRTCARSRNVRCRDWCERRAARVIGVRSGSTAANRRSMRIWWSMPVRPRLGEPGVARGARLPASRGGEGRNRHRLHDAHLSPPPERARRQAWRHHCRQRAELAQRHHPCQNEDLDRRDRRLSRRSRARQRPEFAAYPATLPTTEIHDVVAQAEPLTDFVRYRYAANLRRRYDSSRGSRKGISCSATRFAASIRSTARV